MTVYTKILTPSFKYMRDAIALAKCHPTDDSIKEIINSSIADLGSETLSYWKKNTFGERGVYSPGNLNISFLKRSFSGIAWGLHEIYWEIPDELNASESFVIRDLHIADSLNIFCGSVESLYIKNYGDTNSGKISDVSEMTRDDLDKALDRHFKAYKNGAPMFSRKTVVNTLQDEEMVSQFLVSNSSKTLEMQVLGIINLYWKLRWLSRD